jgi:hypothetical protein
MMRPHFVGAAMGLFACVAIGSTSTPAVATPCTNLQSLHLQDTTITSATDNTTGIFVVPGSVRRSSSQDGAAPTYGFRNELNPSG